MCYLNDDVIFFCSLFFSLDSTVMDWTAVPRLLNRIHDTIYSKVRNNILKRWLLHLAYRQKHKYLARHVIRNNTIWDRLVFNRVRKNFGSNIRLICVGAAPLSSDVLDFLRVAIGCVVSCVESFFLFLCYI